MNLDELILYYYDDGLGAARRAEIEAALRTDPKLAQKYERLCADLDLAGRDPESAPAPEALRRWHETIDRTARAEAARSARRPRIHFGSFAWGSAIGIALTAGIALVALWPAGRIDPGPETPVVAARDSGSPHAFARGLTQYLGRTRQEIATLASAPGGDHAALVMQIIDQNRLFEHAAEQSGAPAVARALRGFEPILLQLLDDELAPERASALQAQLAFELNVVLTRLAREASERSNT